MKTEKTLEIEELAAELVNRGGAIVSSNDCSEKQIRAARRDNRFAALDGLGFVLILARKKRRAVRSGASGRFVRNELAETDKNGTVTEEV